MHSKKKQARPRGFEKGIRAYNQPGISGIIFLNAIFKKNSQKGGSFGRPERA